MEIEIFGLKIPLYGAFYFLGIVVASVLGLFMAKKRGMDWFDFVCAAVYLLIGATLGAKLLFLLVSVEEIIRLDLPLEAVLKGGFVFYGGLLGGALGLFIYGKQFKTSMRAYFDVCATVLPLGHAFGRVGCFFGGCCYGIQYDGVFSYVYKKTSNAHTPIGVELLPIQLIEAFMLLLLFLFLLFLYIKKVDDGVATISYLFGYSILRFVLEFFRGDKERGLFFGLSTSQWISVVLLAVAIVMLIRKVKLNKK